MTVKNLYPSIMPTLNLDFANSKRLDSRITFTRSSTGSYFDGNGVLQTAGINQARFDHNPATGESLGLLVEEARTNDISYSESFTGANWDVKTNVNVIPNAGLAPSNTFTATNLVATTTSGNHLISLYNPHASANSLSLFVKPNGYNQIGLVQNGFQPNALAVFTLTGAGSVSGAGQTIQQCPNGWYRIVYNFGTGLNRYDIYMYNNSGSASFAGDGTSGLLIWGAQWETGTFPTSYIPTPATFTSRASSATYYDASGVIQTAGINVARSAAFFPDSNGVMRSAGLLLEAASTNLHTYSEQFDNAAWTKYGVTVTANAIAAPDGATTADKFASTAGAALLALQQAVTRVASTVYTVSIFAKSAEISSLTLHIGNTTEGTVFVVANLSAGTATNGGVMTKLPNGWYRISRTFTQDSGTVGDFYIRLPDSTVAGSGVYVWGAQLEASPYATSYIATTTATVTRSADVSSSATVTRSADVASMTASPYLYGTFLARYRQQPPAGLNRNIFTVGASNAYSGAFICQAKAANVLSLVVSPVADLLYTSNTEPSGFNNVAAARVLGDYALCLNGGTVAKSTSTTDSANNSVITFMYGTIGATSGGHVSRLTYWPTRLSDATLQAITL